VSRLRFAPRSAPRFAPRSATARPPTLSPAAPSSIATRARAAAGAPAFQGDPPGPRPRRRIALAQNFLRHPDLAERLLDRTTVGPEDVVYEIGPGEGLLTDRLARRCRHVFAVEKDARLAERLRRRFARRPNVTVYLADCLDFPLPVTGYKVVANVPFNITAAVVARLAGAPYPPQDAYLAVQREAAARFTGTGTGAGGETLVALQLKPRFEPQIVHRFARADFVPRPGVDVVLLRLRKRGPPLLAPAELALYQDLVAFAFTAWQPTVRRVLGLLLGVPHAPPPDLDLDLDVPPSALPFESWLTLFRYVRRAAPPEALRAVEGAAERLARQQRGLQKEHRTRAGRGRGRGGRPGGTRRTDPVR
jgi:23S rRNA (adenine-N6)-dimethyltransferase